MKVGLVLAGGGARGAYQIGSWKALKELGIDKHIKVISGTSIGALNSVLFMKGDIDLAEELWTTISREKILPTNERDLALKSFFLNMGIKNIDLIRKYMPRIISGGNISRIGLESIIRSIDLKFINKSDITCYATCTEIPSLKCKYFKLNDYKEELAKKILLATSAIPMIYDIEEVKGIKYLDGGIVDNIPITPVYEEGCDIIIIIHLSKESNLNKREYPNSSIIEITPTVIEKGAFEGVLDFNVDIAKEKMSIGYEDTMDSIGAIFRLAKSIEKDNSKIHSKSKLSNKVNNYFK